MLALSFSSSGMSSPFSTLVLVVQLCPLASWVKVKFKLIATDLNHGFFSLYLFYLAPG